MFSLIKQKFIVLLNFSKSLVTKCLFLNDELCLVRPTLIDLNPVELKYYPFRISLDKFTGICNIISSKCVPKEIKDVNVQAFSMITNKYENKTTAKHISSDCKWKFNNTTCNSNQKENNKLVNMNVKIIVHVKKIIVGILAHGYVRITSI